MTLIRSIEWLTLGPETAPEALVQSNAVARYFLGKHLLVGRVQYSCTALGNAAAAQALLKTLPVELAAIDDDRDNHASEHEHYRALFTVFACHEAVDDVLSRTPKNTYVTIASRSRGTHADRAVRPRWSNTRGARISSQP